MEERSFICINCPLGCPLTVRTDGTGAVHVSGNTCRLGETYARKEVTNPTRTVTSTVRVLGGTAKLVSVKTKEAIPKEKILSFAEALKDVAVSSPVQTGDVILANVAGTGVDIVATKTVL